MGRLAFTNDPGRLHDWQVYNPDLQSFPGAHYPLPQWSSPPHPMPLAIPFGQLPCLAAYIVWTGLGIVALYHGARHSVRPLSLAGSMAD